MVNPEEAALATLRSSAAPQAQAQPAQQNITVTSLPDVESTAPPADEYTKFIRKLEKHFLPKKNKDFARFQLGNLQQEEDESLAKYFAREREIAKKCEYQDENDAIRDHLIKTMRNRRIRVNAIRQGWTLQEVLDEAAIDEETNQQATEMEKKISHEEKDVKRVEETPASKPCGRCGRKHTQKCSAFGATCTACGNETITQTSAAVNLKKRKAIDHSKTNPTIRKIPEQDAISEDEEIIEDQAIVMRKFTKCQVTRESTGSPIPATHRAMNVLSITSRSTKSEPRHSKDLHYLHKRHRNHS